MMIKSFKQLFLQKDDTSCLYTLNSLQFLNIYTDNYIGMGEKRA